MSLPILDLSSFAQGGIADRQKFAFGLLDGLSQHGFVKLVGHGIPDNVIKQIFEWSKSFFRLDDQHKVSIVHPGGDSPQRGWSTVGAEKSSSLYQKGFLKSNISVDPKDAREHFDQGPKEDDQFPNRWPSEDILPGFRQSMEDTFEKFEQVAATIMGALEVAFDLPKGVFLEKITHQGNSSEFRLNHYPAIDIREIKGGHVSRIWPHFDLGVITLLFQDGVGGLEFENRKKKGTFMRVGCGDPTELVVNVSETLQRWTNGVLPAGLHRVSLPEELDGKDSGWLSERYSVAYFCKADRDASVAPLSSFIPDGSMPKYDDITAIQYHQQRLTSAY